MTGWKPWCRSFRLTSAQSEITPVCQQQQQQQQQTHKNIVIPKTVAAVNTSEILSDAIYILFSENQVDCHHL